MSIAWFGLFAVAYFVLYAPIYTDAAGIACTVLYALTVAATVLSGYKCMRTDPADPNVLAKHAAVLAGLPPPRPLGGAVNYCYLCEAHVNKRSKHCRRRAPPP